MQTSLAATIDMLQTDNMVADKPIRPISVSRKCPGVLIVRGMEADKPCILVPDPSHLAATNNGKCTRMQGSAQLRATIRDSTAGTMSATPQENRPRLFDFYPADNIPCQPLQVPRKG
jgi:hypothetical protein